MKTAILLLALLAFSTLPACYSSGAKQIADPGTMAKIEVGKSTQADVKALLGEPNSIGPSARIGGEAWIYVHSSIKTRPTSFIPVIGPLVGGADGKVRSVIIYFDKNGVVQEVKPGTRIDSHGGSIFD